MPVDFGFNRSRSHTRIPPKCLQRKEDLAGRDVQPGVTKLNSINSNLNLSTLNRYSRAYRYSVDVLFQFARSHKNDCRRD